MSGIMALGAYLYIYTPPRWVCKHLAGGLWSTSEVSTSSWALTDQAFVPIVLSRCEGDAPTPNQARQVN